MIVWFRLYILLSLGIVKAATKDRQRYTSVDNLVGKTTLATGERLSRVLCALHCMELNGAGFSYDAVTRECKIFKETFIGQSGKLKTRMSSNTYGKIDACDIVPFLREERRNYNIEHPHMGDISLTRYRCTNFTDTEPVNSCPVSRCEKYWSPASLSCTEKDVFKNSKPYEGRVTCTVKGVTCQRWDSNTPHTPFFFKNRPDLHNWCQIDSETRPWCYTTDPDIRWDYCPVQERIVCNNPPPVTLSGISLVIEWPYNDALSLARYRCPTFVATEPNTSCPVVRCHSDHSWSTANVSCSDGDCYDSINKIYNGRVSCTWSGITCQRWDSDYPNRPSTNRGRSDLGNRCVIEGEERPWCYSVDPSVRWDFCPVDECV